MVGGNRHIFLFLKMLQQMHNGKNLVLCIGASRGMKTHTYSQQTETGIE